MSWAKADDRYDDTSKIKRAWRLSGYAVGLHWMSVTSCARHESDGLVDPEWLAERLAVIPQKDARKAVDTLVTLGLYEQLAAGEQRTVRDRHGNAVTLGPRGEDAYIVHDYLDYQDSAATLEAKRADERLRKAISARARELSLSIADYRKTPGFRVDFPPDSARVPPRSPPESERLPKTPTRPDPTRPDHKEEPPPAPPSKLGGEQGQPEDAPHVPRKNSRLEGTNPRTTDATAVADTAAIQAAVAAAALGAPTDEHRAGWEQLRAAMETALGDGSSWALYAEQFFLAGVDESGALVVDGPPAAWSWTRGRTVLARCVERVGVPARLATEAEHEGLALGAAA